MISKLFYSFRLSISQTDIEIGLVFIITKFCFEIEICNNLTEKNIESSSKISRYTPSENAKVYEKAVHRVQVPNFNPKQTIDIINKERSQDIELTEDEKRQLLQQYLDVSNPFA